ncbi:MAG: heavy metal-binding domain-containing protein [Bacteroidota bacterium]
MNILKRIIILLFLWSVTVQNASAQSCCSGGSSCPIAGGASQGVLAEKQMELNTNYQYISSVKFLNGDTADVNFLDRFYSNYNYMRVAYGLSNKLTFSVESGYFFNKTQIGLDKRDTISSKGIGDLILFPRYNAYHHVSTKGNFDVTVGVGLKLPVGSYTDSLKQIEPFSGSIYYLRKPPAVQPSTGAQDFIFYALVFKGFAKQKFRIFTNMLYIRKGWNSLGEKSGDYASAGLFLSKSFLKNAGAVLELKGEHIEHLKLNNDLLSMGFYNYDTYATGGNRLMLVPQLSYSFKSLNVFASTEIPLYQFVNGTQIASQYLFSAGISYKFFPFKKQIASGTYYCEMHPDVTSDKPAKCPKCGMDLIQKK